MILNVELHLSTGIFSLRVFFALSHQQTFFLDSLRHGCVLLMYHKRKIHSVLNSPQDNGVKCCKNKNEANISRYTGFFRILQKFASPFFFTIIVFMPALLKILSLIFFRFTHIVFVFEHFVHRRKKLLWQEK